MSTTVEKQEKIEITFQSMGLPESLLHTLEHMKIVKPTPIQEQAIPVALKGRDILGSAQTGTGKTAAFGIPLIRHLLSNERGTALVMTPTRELATQVMSQLESMLGRHSKIKTALLIGGASMTKQFQELKREPRLVVGTPGRIYDHLERRSLNLSDTNFLVLDETDRMLDMGFSIQIDAIMEYMPKEKQTLLFSATLPKNIVRISDKYLNDPVRVEIGQTSQPAKNIDQKVVHLSHQEKYPKLLSELQTREGSVVIFVKTKMGAKRMAEQLYREGHRSEAIHGDLRQHKRDRVIAGFRKHKYRVLVATDVAARGLDIPHIEHVINYDLPQCAEDYIHRIGRTARAGAKGSALCFVSPDSRRQWDAIDRLLNPGKSFPKRDRESKGGFKRREGGFKGRSGGFSDRREGGFSKRREGGFGAKREGGFEKRSEGFSDRREGGFGNREGGFSKRREGGFGVKREGGFSDRRERVFGSNREEGFKGRREGSSYKKREGFSGKSEGFSGKKRDRNDFFGKKRDVKQVKRVKRDS